MNYLDPNLPNQREARLRYLDHEFEVSARRRFRALRVSGDPIRLENLRYWDVEQQMAFARRRSPLRVSGQALTAAGRHASLKKPATVLSVPQDWSKIPSLIR